MPLKYLVCVRQSNVFKVVQPEKDLYVVNKHSRKSKSRQEMEGEKHCLRGFEE